MTQTAASTPSAPRSLPITVSAHPRTPWPAPETRRRRRVVHLIALGAIALGTAYLMWRIVETLTPASALLGVPLLILEAWSLGALALAVVALWDLDRVGRPDEVTATDRRIAVMIPTVDEPLEVLMPVLAAATRMRLASEIIVLDDGHREWLAGMCDELGIEYRTRSARSGGTGAQLNAVLATLDAEFVVILDADQVADRDLIGHTLGHFDDKRVALVQTARGYYNSGSFEHVTQDKVEVVQNDPIAEALGAGRNRWGSAFWTGGAAMMRTSALASIDGIATATSPGMTTSIRLHKAGWRSVHHPAVLARGRAAADAAEFADQLAAACSGDMTVLRRDRVVAGRGLTLGQRVSYLTTLTSWFSGWRTLGYLLVPAAALLFALTPATGPVALFVALFLGLAVVRRVTRRVLLRGRPMPTESAVFSVLRMTATLAPTLRVLTGREAAPTTTPEEDSRRVPALLWALVAVNALALGWGVASWAVRTDAAYPYPLIAALAAVWTSANLVVLSRAISRIRSPHFGGDRRLAHRLEVEGHVYVDGQRAHVLDLSLTGVRLLSYGEVPEVGSYCAMTFTDPNRRPAVVTGTVIDVQRRPHGHEVRVGFEADQTYVLGAILAEALIHSA
jgi:cellulose synthase (UDP-forming)